MKKITTLFLLLVVCLVQQAMAQYLGSPGSVRLRTDVTQAGPDMYVLENGRMGLIIPRQGAFNPANPTQALAPVQAVIYHDNTRSDNSANYIDCGRQNITGTTVTIEAQTGSMVRVAYHYTYTVNGQTKYYKSIVELSATAQSARILEEANTDACWEVKFSDGLNPTQGRYRGWGNYIVGNAGNPDDGYENINGQRVAYRTWNHPNRGDALVDLQFTNQKKYKLQLWECGGNAAIGYYYQFYNPNPASGNNRLFGVFQGRPSKLLRASVMGGSNYTSVNIITRPGGVRYLKGDKDANNHHHYTWVTQDDELYYAQTDASGAIVQSATFIASGVTHPNIYLQGNTPVIHAVRPGPGGGTVVRYKRTAGGTFSNEDITFNTNPPAMDAGFTRIALAASNNLYELLLVSGGLVNGVRKLHLYKRTLNGNGVFTLSDDLECMPSYIQMFMPDMKMTADGKVQVFFVKGFMSNIAVINPGSNTFSQQQAVYGVEAWSNLDLSIDRHTARSYSTRDTKWPAVWQPNASGIICLGGTPHNQQQFLSGSNVENTPNTTSVAFDGTGNALLYLRGKFYRYEAANGPVGTWTQLTGTLSLATQDAAVFFTNGSFRVTGVYNGELRQFSYTLGNADFSLLTPVVSNASNTAVARSQVMMLDDGQQTAALRRFEWCIYVGNQATDLPASPTVIQPIGVEMNHQSGLGNRIQGYYDATPAVANNFDLAAIYSSSTVVQNVIQKVKNSQSSAYYNFLMSFDPYYQPIFNAWRDVSGALGRTMALQLIAEMQDAVDNYRTGQGVYRSDLHYISGSKHFAFRSTTAACLLADNNIRSQLTPQEIANLKRLVSFYGRILWDEDNVPIKYWDNAALHPGVGLSTENMPPAYLNARAFFALLLKNDTDPVQDFPARAATIQQQTQTIIQNSFNDCGAPYGTPHYTQPANEPTFFLMLQMQNLNPGSIDLFNINYAKFKKHAHYLFTLATPVNPRFSNSNGNTAYRKMVGFGDGQEEVSIAAGLLGAGIGATDPALRSQLLSSYYNGKFKYSVNGPIWLVIDYDQPHNDLLPLGSANVDGYVSHLRSGAYTANESAGWLVNGMQYRDHRHDDAGQVALYGLNTPISISWDGNSAPHKNHGAMRGMVLPHSFFTDWDNTVQGQPVSDPVTSNHTWPNNQTKEFGKFGISSFATAEMKNQGQTVTWDRTLRLLSPRIDRPVFVIRDVIRDAGGGITNNAHIWSMPVMSDGVINVAGIGTNQAYTQQLNPVDRFWPTSMGYSGGPQPLPTATQTTPGAGLYRFNFIGTLWNKPAEPAKGVDVNVYALTDAPVNYNASRWSSNFIETIEGDEFFKATGRSFMQTQQFLRIRAAGEFFTVVLPFNKGTDPYNGKVTQSAPGEIKVAFDNTDLYVGKEYAFYNGGANLKTFTTYSNATYSNGTEGVTMTGGAAELTLEPLRAVVRVHGNSGMRSITIPRAGYVLQGTDNTVTTANTTNSMETQITINYTGTGNCVSPGEQGYKELVFVPGGLYNSQTTANSPICTGGSLQLNVVPGANGATYQWTGPNGFSSQLKNPVISNVTTAAAGTYQCVMTVSGTAINLPPVTVVVKPTPAARTLSYNSPVCVGGTLSLSANPVNNSLANYQWTGPSGSLPYNGNTFSIFNVNTSHAGTYTCTVTDDGCTSPVASITVTVLPAGNCGGGGGSTDRVRPGSQPKAEVPVALGIYPNPTSGTVTLNPGKRLTDVTVELLTVAAKKVYSQRMGIVAGAVAIQLPSELPAGTYLMRILHSGGVIRTRLVLQRKQ
jgi:hypothetical protein